VQYTGFAAVTARGGTGAQLMRLTGIDNALTGAVQTSMIIDGNDTFGTDVGDDILVVETLPAGITASLLGGPNTAGNTYAVDNWTTGNLDGVLGQVVVSPLSDIPGGFLDWLIVLDDTAAAGDTDPSEATDGCCGPYRHRHDDSATLPTSRATPRRT